MSGAALVVLVLLGAALVLTLIELDRSGRALLAWAVLLVAIAELVARLA